MVGGSWWGGHGGGGHVLTRWVLAPRSSSSSWARAAPARRTSPCARRHGLGTSAGGRKTLQRAVCNVHLPLQKINRRPSPPSPSSPAPPAPLPLASPFSGSPGFATERMKEKTVLGIEHDGSPPHEERPTPMKETHPNEETHHEETHPNEERPSLMRRDPA